MNTNPAMAGIHSSGTAQRVMRYTPTDLVHPEAKMKLTLMPNPRNSVTLRPSRKPKINPQIMPSGRPLTNKQTTWAHEGTRGSKSNGKNARPINPAISAIRRPAPASLTTLIPKNLERVYPTNWATTSNTFNDMPPISCPENVAAEKGLRNAYIAV